jgi:hypothetical protein
MQGANFTAGLGAGDVLCANGKTSLAINVNVTCLRISTAVESGGADGGGFTVASARTIAANIQAGNSSACVVASGSAYTLTINGNIAGSIGGSIGYNGISNVGTATILVTGNVIGSSGGAPGYGIYNTSTGSITVTGSITAGTASGCHGLANNSTGAITVYGPVAGASGQAAYGILNNSTGAVTVTGNVTAGVGSGIYNISTGVVTINSGNLINTSTAQAVTGLLSVYNPGASNYIRCPKTSGTIDCALEQAANVRSGTPDGDVTGTMAVPLAAQVLYNVPVDNTVGTYVEATAAQVSLGTNFGPSSSYTGTDLPASGPLVGAGGLVE